jgi:hypothetical protein
MAELGRLAFGAIAFGKSGCDREDSVWENIPKSITYADNTTQFW